MRFERLKDFVATMIVVLVTAAAFGVGGFFLQPALSQTTALWPQVTGVTVLTPTSGQIIGTNPSRRFLQICNPSAAVIVWIAPGSTSAAANGGGSISIPPVASNTTTCINIPPINLGPAGSSVGQSWNAIAITTATSLTILEY